MASAQKWMEDLLRRTIEIAHYAHDQGNNKPSTQTSHLRRAKVKYQKLKFIVQPYTPCIRVERVAASQTAKQESPMCKYSLSCNTNRHTLF